MMCDFYTVDKGKKNLAGTLSEACLPDFHTVTVLRMG